MKKTFLLFAILLLSIAPMFAGKVQVMTSCGRTVTLESSDYRNGQEMADAAYAIDGVVCP